MAYLIGLEKNLDKKIQFLLETKNYENALSSALSGGDPIVINNVFSVIIAKQGESKVVEYANNLGKECQRLLKNYARNRGNFGLVKTVNGKYDNSYILAQMRKANEEADPKIRKDILNGIIKIIPDDKNVFA